MIDKETCVILMVKYAILGRVKSRLALHIGDEYALELYKLFVADMITAVKKENIKLKIAYTPLNRLKDFKEWLGDGFAYLPQNGNDLGDRLISVFRGAFEAGIRYAVALVSDAPDLPGDIIARAISGLEDNDAVVGPCPDGGYYLIGFRKSTFNEDVFKLKAWSNQDVLPATIKKIKDAGLKYFELPLWNDIDNIDDLLEVVQKNRGASAFKSLNYINNNHDLLQLIKGWRKPI